MCRQVTPVPSNGTANLQSAFHVHHLFEIRSDLLKVPVGGGCQDSLGVNDVCCSKHAGKKLDLYCETCEEFICFQCTIKLHHSHQYDLVAEILGRHRKKLSLSLEPLEAKIIAIDKAMLRIDTRCEEIIDKRVVLENTLDYQFRQFQVALESRKLELLQQLHSVCEVKLSKLTAQKEEVKSVQVKLNLSLMSIKGWLTATNLKEVLYLKETLMVKRGIDEATSLFPLCLLEPTEKDDMDFRTTEDMHRVCRRFGLICSRDMPSLMKSQLMGQGLEQAEVEEKSRVAFVPINVDNELCKKSIEADLRCEFVSMLTGMSIRCGVVEKKESDYEIGYVPSVKGRHLLSIKIKGMDIKGSPFNVSVRMPLSKLGQRKTCSPITIISDVEAPCGVALTSTGEIIVSESSRNQISVFKCNGEKCLSFGVAGSGCGEFSNPSGLAIDAEGNILVADQWNNRVQKFTSSGHYLASSCLADAANVQGLKSPSGIAVNSINKKIYVTDHLNCRVVVLNFDLTYCSSFGKKGSGKGQFLNPWDVACTQDGTGRLCVTDCLNNRVQVFTSEGDFVKKFGKKGQGRGDLDNPAGVCVDKENYVYITELGTHRVSVFTLEGQLVTVFGKEGDDIGDFNNPQRLTVDSCGVLYICDSGNDKLKLF